MRIKPCLLVWLDACNTLAWARAEEASALCSCKAQFLLLPLPKQAARLGSQKSALLVSSQDVCRWCWGVHSCNKVFIFLIHSGAYNLA